MSFSEKSNRNEKKALVRVLEIDGGSNFQKEVLGFGVKLKKDQETNSYMFLTSSSVLRSPLWIPRESKIVAERYCSKYPDHLRRSDHREKIYKVTSSVDDHVSFAFYDGESEEGFLEVDDGTFYETLQMHNTLYAYAFEGKDIVALIFEDKYSSNEYKLTRVSKESFPIKKAKGAPIIHYDQCSDKPKVVGILDIKSDGNLYPVFLTEKNLEVKSVDPEEMQEAEASDANPQDEKDSPIVNNAKNGRPDALVTDEPDTIHPSDNQATKQITVVTGHQKQKEVITMSDFNLEMEITYHVTNYKKPATVFQEESKCFKYDKINEALPNNLQRRLVIKLDPERPLGGDICDLAHAYGYNQEEINFLKNLRNPTKELLQQKGNSTLLCLRDKLKTIGRDDAADLVDGHIRNNCHCEQCGNLR
ncbi:uncharacterized protein LOC116298394 isoform X2 [Actinia tenebrosa]|uniref:Uncharacterized protein LOC116298394 isoform X2 n=1 Tax=Actinia tenebrosa TaxID=6105 RepID=A0A6P8IB96_ACTTE|nr:uncharacterized protein LOC116298394 isoform X2 [Actinia tenebrosa]